VLTGAVAVRTAVQVTELRSADAGIELEVDGFALSGSDGYDPGLSLREREPVCGRLY
jgi:hypothetical protein